MFIELIDSLRCPHDHDESWLVASIADRSDRDIITGTLGCPVCRAEFPIERGIATFGCGAPASSAVRDPYEENDDDVAVRCAALLDLYDGGGVVVIAGSWIRAARALLELAPVMLLVVDPPPAMPMGSGLSGIRIGDILPLARGSARGMAMDGESLTARLLSSAARALRPGGRLLAPLHAALPPGITERARDDRHWLGEADTTLVPVPVTVKRSR